MSSLEASDATLCNAPQIEKKHIVKTAPLKDLLLEYRIPRDFDFLNIDVEGHEMSTLISLDLASFRPKLIIVEIHDLNIMCPGEHPIVQFMLEHQYQLVAYAIMNAYFCPG